MDTKDLRSLMEAYSEVYAPQQLDELSDRKMRAYIKKSQKSHQAINKKWDQGTATEKEKLKSIGHEIGQQRALKKLNKEELDIFDVVLEFLQSEGYAETLEEAEWIMSNELDAEDIEAILEGSYEDRIAANNKKYDANRKRAAQRAAARNAARDAGKTGAVPGVGYVTPRKERETYTDSSGKTRHAKGL